MANSKVLFSDLRSGKCSSSVDARLLRFWEARNFKRGGELMWVDMLMVDVNANMMQATINANRVPVFRQKLTAGSVYSISGFDVARCGQQYRLTDSDLMIRFNDSTSLDEITEPGSPLPGEGFRFRNQTELLGLANTNTHLPDIVGEIIDVKSTVTDPPHEKNHIMATINLAGGASVTFSVFDAQAVAFHKQLEAMRVGPKVIVATSINPKMVGGRLFLNATSGTHIYFDKDTAAGESLFYRLVARDTGLPPAAPLLRGYAKVEHLTVAELNSFVITAPSQDIDFMCTGRVTGIDTDKGWCYVACSKCTKKLQRTTSSFLCARCDNNHAVGSLRYRVEMTISDDTAQGVFVCFDGVMTKLHNLKATDAGQMLAEAGVNPEDSQMPPFIVGMEGKTYTFQVRVTAYNFTANHQTFTITRILGDPDRVPLPAFVDNDGDDNDGHDMPRGKPVRINVESGGLSGEAAFEAGAGKVIKKGRVA